MKIIPRCIRKMAVFCVIMVLFIAAGCEEANNGNATSVAIDSSPDDGVQTTASQNSSGQSSSSSSSDSSTQATINFSN